MQYFSDSNFHHVFKQEFSNEHPCCNNPRMNFSIIIPELYECIEKFRNYITLLQDK